MVTETGFDPESVHHPCINKSVNFSVFVLNPKSAYVSFLNIKKQYVAINTVTHIIGRNIQTD